jgi:hypothetical protein
MKITFDSNVWQIVVNPENYLGEPSIEKFRLLNEAINSGKIEAFLSATIFTIEAIKRLDRKDFFSSRKPKTTTEIDVDNNMVGLGFTIGPGDQDSINFDDTPILKKYFNEALQQGFKIVDSPRIGIFKNLEVEKELSKQDSFFYDRQAEVGDKIEASGAGISQIKEIGNAHSNRSWMRGLKKALDSDKKKIAKAAAEWADGDSVATSIALGCDFFCTRDNANGAGSKSVLSTNNKEMLNAEYGFKAITPEKLAEIIKSL